MTSPFVRRSKYERLRREHELLRFYWGFVRDGAATQELIERLGFEVVETSTKRLMRLRRSSAE